jgi:ATP-dependent DNA ligase
MPFLRRKTEPPPPIDPADWRPQAFGRGGFRSINDPIVEPKWGGVRILARVATGPDGIALATLTDEDGDDATAEFEDLALAIAAAALADELVLDGYLTVEATQNPIGMDMEVVEAPTQGQMMAQFIAGDRLRRRFQKERNLDPERPIAFVAVDLLSIEGTSLIDIPLLERKRLLDGALKVDAVVRITPYVRPPIGSLALTWHSQGFRHMAYKPSGGRYLPTGKPSDWVIVPIVLR